MATKVIIPTSYGSPSATFWINDKKHVLPTGVEVTAPDEVALLVAQHQAQEKREEPSRYLPDVVDVVFTFDGLSNTGQFQGTANKTFEDIVNELGGRGVERLNLVIKNQDISSIPFRIRMTDTLIVACWIGLYNTEDGIRVYKVTKAANSELRATGQLMLSIPASS